MIPKIRTVENVIVVTANADFNPLHELNKLGEELQQLELRGLVIFDMIAVNGLADNRFCSILFDGEIFHRERFMVPAVPSETLKRIKEEQNSLIRNDEEFLRGTVLSSSEIESILSDTRELCLICLAGHLHNKIEHDVHTLIEYSICDACGSEQANPEQVRRNKQRMIEYRENNKLTNFFLEANKMAEKGNIDQALDLIFEDMDYLCRKHEFELINQFVQELDFKTINTDVLLALLITTRWARDNFKDRKKVYDQIKDEITSRGDMEDGLLDGLE